MLRDLQKGTHTGGADYRCDKWVETLNPLRQLGKEKCLAVLRAYFAEHHDHERILIVCRLLFVNPKGWDPPPLGGLDPPVEKEAKMKFPLFPIAVSEGVPIFIVWGYKSGGKIGGGPECLKLCEQLDLIKDAYSTTGYEKAARSLTQSQDFLQLYSESDRPRMVNMILDQAKKSKK